MSPRRQVTIRIMSTSVLQPKEAYKPPRVPELELKQIKLIYGTVQVKSKRRVDMGARALRLGAGDLKMRISPLKHRRVGNAPFALSNTRPYNGHLINMACEGVGYVL